MTDLTQGDKWHCSTIGMDFTIAKDINTRGMSVCEMDSIMVPIEWEDGQTTRVPHERFRGRKSYERV